MAKEGYEVDIIKGKTNSEARTRVLNDNELNRLWTRIWKGLKSDIKRNIKYFKDCLQFIFYTGASEGSKSSQKEWLRKK